MAKKRGSPAQERGICPKCGGKTLGNTYTACPRGGQPAYAYRQCGNNRCGHIHKLGDVAWSEPAKSSFPRNKTEQAVFDHYMTGCERGDLYRYVKMGKAGMRAPERSMGNAYAAWMAGKTLADSDAG